MQLHYPLDPATGNENQGLLPWNNGVPATGQEGSYPPYQAVVFPMEELVNLIVSAGITPSDGDLNQVTEAVKGLIAAAVKTYVAAPNGGLVLTGNGFGLGFDNLPVETGFSDADKIAFYTEETEDGLPAGTAFAGTCSALASYILAKVPAAPAGPSQTALWHEGTIGGTATAMTTTLTPPATADAAGINMRLTVSGFANAANSTLDFGFGPKPLIINSTAQAVAGGEMVPNEGHIIDCFYDGTHVRLINPFKASAASSASYVQYRVYNTAGSFTFTPDAACKAIEVVGCWGGGGGGAYSGGTVAGGGGGGFASGAYTVAPGAAITVVVGAGGTGGTSGAGGTGGSSSVGSLCSATGGGGANGNTPGGGGQGYSIDGAQVQLPGLSGTVGTTPGSGNYFPGAGGASYGCGRNITTGPVYNGASAGQGGSGGNSISGPNAGGSGAAGLIIIKQIIG